MIGAAPRFDAYGICFSFFFSFFFFLFVIFAAMVALLVFILLFFSFYSVPVYYPTCMLVRVLP